MDPAVRRRLLQTNPWMVDRAHWEREIRARLPAPFVPRQVDPAGFDDPRKAKLIVGPRQAGKSTWVWSQLRARAPETVLYVDAEEQLLQQWTGSAAQVLADLASDFPTVRSVFIEEAQHLVDAGLFVKGLVDSRRDLDVLVTGSSSYHLAARTRESLAGRAIRRQLLPFSLDEILAFEAPAVPAAVAERARDIRERQMRYGAYPGVWFAEEPERELAELVEAFVLRDASDRFEIRLPEAFRRLLQLVAGQVGQVVNQTEWAGILGVSASTVREWLGLLEETWIVRLVPPFAGGKRREITGAPRVHLHDMGVRNALLGTFTPVTPLRPDLGALAEGWVFGELAKTVPREWTLHYWRARGGAEMDFVVARGERVIGVEVKAGRPRTMSRSTRSFIDAYAPEAVLVACAADAATERLDRTEVRFVPLEWVGRELASFLQARGG